jgi:pyruvate-formate lyase-activating enzyme
LITELQQYDITPLCVCDGNPTLHGSLCCDIEVMSIESAIELFGDFLVYTRNVQKRYEIIHYLESTAKIAKERIINYVPLFLKKGCHFLTSGCVVLNNHLHFCCGDTGKIWDTPSVEFDGDYDKLVDEFIELREKTIQELEVGIRNKCSDCPLVCDVYIPQFFELTSIRDGRFSVCNFKCVYCCANRERHSDNVINLPKLINAFEQKQTFALNANVYYANGELTVNPERKEIYECMKSFTQNQISTNAFIYSPEIAELLQTNTVILVSMDSGTPETFRKVKGVDGWTGVCDTLRKYSISALEGAIELKYIFLPGLNDNTTDINGFFALAKEIKAGRVFISSDYTNEQAITEHTIEMAKYFFNQAKLLNFPIVSSSQFMSKKLGIAYTS